MIFLKHESNLVLPPLMSLSGSVSPSDEVYAQHKIQGLMIYLQFTPPVLTIAISLSNFTVETYLITFTPTRTVLSLLWPFAYLGTQPVMIFSLSFSFTWLMLILYLFIEMKGFLLSSLILGNLISVYIAMVSWVLKVVVLWGYLSVPLSFKWTSVIFLRF